MGRPPSCGCCGGGGGGGGGDPVGTCVTNYYDTPWAVEKNINSTIGLVQNDFFGIPFFGWVSGELLRAAWYFTNPTVPASSIRTGDWCCEETLLIDPCITGSGAIENVFIRYDIQDPEYIWCDYTNSTHYEFVAKKTCIFESGVTIYTQTTTVLNPHVNYSISITPLFGVLSGISRGGANIPLWWDGTDGDFHIGCVGTLCDSDYYTTEGSGVYEIEISGCTGTSFDCLNGDCVPRVGFVDFIIIPCANIQNLSGVQVYSQVALAQQANFSYGLNCSYPLINGYNDFCPNNGQCYDCYHRCQDCDGWYVEGSMPPFFPPSGGYYPWDDPRWLAACSGNVPVACSNTPNDSGNFGGGSSNLGAGWAVKSAFCEDLLELGSCGGLPRYYKAYETVAACCINGVCCMLTCKDCADLGGEWQGAGTSCFGGNPIFCEGGGET